MIINVFLLCIFSFGSYADSDYLFEKASEYQKVKVQAKSVKNRERKILSKIYKINRKQRKLAADKSKLTLERERLNSELKFINKRINYSIKKLNETKSRIKRRLRFAKHTGSSFLTRLILADEDFFEVDKKLRVMYKMTNYDINQIKKYKEIKKTLISQKEKKMIFAQSVKENEKLIKNKEKQFDKSYSQKMKILSNLNKEDKKIFKKISNIKKNAKNYAARNNLEDLVIMFEDSLYEKKGRIGLPTKGVVKNRFGILDLPFEKIKIYQKGWYIQTQKPEPVIAIGDGKISYIGYIQDLGSTVIVDHGDHYYSVYANLGNIKFKKNSHVKRDAVLGVTGTTRFLKQGLYFEIRHFSEPQDPADWISDSTLKISSIGDGV